MGEFDYGADKFFVPLTIDSSNQDIVIHEDPDDDGTYENQSTISISEGDYFNHSTGSGLSPDGNAGLLSAIETAINADGTLDGTYVIEAATPPMGALSPTYGNELTNSGIVIKETSPIPWKLVLSDANWTLPNKWLGFEVCTAVSDRTSTLDSGAHEIPSPFSLWGQWQVHTLVGDKASDKTSRDVQSMRASSDDMEQARVQKYNTITVRNFEYEVVPGAMARQNRGHDQGSAIMARIPWDDTLCVDPYGDVHNAWEDLFYLMTEPNTSTGNLVDVMAVYDTGDDSNAHSVDTGADDKSVEVLRFRAEGGSDNFSDPSEYWSKKRHGELYKIQWQMQVIDSYSYRQ